MPRVTPDQLRDDFCDELTDVTTRLRGQAKRIEDMIKTGLLPDTGLPSKNIDGAMLGIQKLHKLAIDIDAKLELAEKGLLEKLEKLNERQQRFRDNQKKKSQDEANDKKKK